MHIIILLLLYIAYTPAYHWVMLQMAGKGLGLGYKSRIEAVGCWTYMQQHPLSSIDLNCIIATDNEHRLTPFCGHFLFILKHYTECIHCHAPHKSCIMGCCWPQAHFLYIHPDVVCLHGHFTLNCCYQLYYPKCVLFTLKILLMILLDPGVTIMGA